jgi:hypothetical protein
MAISMRSSNLPLTMPIMYYSGAGFLSLFFLQNFLKGDKSDLSDSPVVNFSSVKRRRLCGCGTSSWFLLRQSTSHAVYLRKRGHLTQSSRKLVFSILFIERCQIESGFRDRSF